MVSGQSNGRSDNLMKKFCLAIVGGGPAAFYTSKLLLRLPCEPYVDIYEKQLCPFGLIRYGVAPDHISIKKSQTVLSEEAHHPHFRYFGNYEATPERLQLMKKAYSGIVYAYGAASNHVPKWLKQAKQTANVKYARDLVYWYNGHPDQENRKQNLRAVKNIVIIGNGNVAIDVARILLRKPSQLAKTQISKNALNQLQECDIKNIEIVGRRGVTHSAFAIKQVRELHSLGFKLYAVQEELQDSMTPASRIQCTAIGDHFNSVVRMNKRKVSFIKENFTILKQADIAKEKQKPFKKIFFRYLLNPKKLSTSSSLVCEKTALHGEAFKQKSEPTGQQQSLNFDLLVISTGFEVSPLEQDHFDSTRRRVRNSDGCVISTSRDKLDLGHYAVGWCKSGPKGVLDETLLGCEETLNNIRIHLQNSMLEQKARPPAPQKYISFDQYLQVKELELSKGNREKHIKNKLTNKQLRQIYGLPPDT